jgi:hypothetical protein
MAPDRERSREWIKTDGVVIGQNQLNQNTKCLLKKNRMKSSLGLSIPVHNCMYICVRGGPNQPLHRDPQWSIVLS